MSYWTINFQQLRPVKRKQISDRVSERLNISAETVDEIISCYYNAVQRKLSGLEHPQITVDSLGTFYIKRSKLEKKLDIYQKALNKYESIEEPNIREYASIKDLKANIAMFNKMLRELIKLDDKKQSKEEEKEIYKTTKDESN